MSPPDREPGGTHRELRERPAKFIPYFSPLHLPLGTLACRVGSGVYLTTPFAGVSVSSHRPSPAALHRLPPWTSRVQLRPRPPRRISGTRVPFPAGLGSEGKAPSGAGRGRGNAKRAQAREAGRASVSAAMREKLFSHLSIYTFTMMITFTDCF